MSSATKRSMIRSGQRGPAGQKCSQGSIRNMHVVPIALDVAPGGSIGVYFQHHYLPNATSSTPSSRHSCDQELVHTVTWCISTLSEWFRAITETQNSSHWLQTFHFKILNLII